MIKKLAAKAEKSLGKFPPIKARKKVENSDPTNVATHSVQKIRKKTSWAARKFERSPKTDTFHSTGSVKKSVQHTPSKPAKTNKGERSGSRVGDFLIQKNKELAEAYKDDLERIAQILPEVTFFRDENKTSAKELKSILAKLEKRSAQFLERGYRGVIRDSVRARIFMPDADKYYSKIVDAMKNEGYKVAKNFEEDAEGNAIKNADGTFKMIDDIDIRFGKNARKSGYEDVQIRFQKGDVLYELIILPGPNYMHAANKEHKVFENIKKYTNYGLDKDMGAKQIIAAISEVFAGFSKRLYSEALLRDKGGAKKITEPTTFTKEEIKDINALFKSLKTLFLGKFNALPPSKKTQAEFKDTKTFTYLNSLEINLKKFVDLYKPIQEVK